MSHTLPRLVFPTINHGIKGKVLLISATFFTAGILLSGDAYCQEPLAAKDTGTYTLTDKTNQQTTLKITKVRNGLVREFYLGEIHYWWDAADKRYYRKGSLYCLYFEYLSPGVYKYEVYDTWWNRTVESGSAL